MPARFITRTRLLPYHGTVKAREGDWVRATDVVAELDYVPGVLAKTQIASQLHIPPGQLSAHMLCSVGDRVEQGEPLATSIIFGEAKQALSTVSGYVALISNSQGMVYVRQPVPASDNEPVVIDLVKEMKISKLALIPALRVRPGRIVTPGQVLAMTQEVKPRVVVSPIYGRVESYSDGILTIMPMWARTTLNAYLTGRVKRVIPGQGVEVQAYAHVVTGVYGVGSESGGELMLAADAGEELSPAAVTEQWRGKVVVAGRTASLELLQAAAEMGCAGMVLGHLGFNTLSKYVGLYSRPGVAGEDEVAMPIMLTERFSPAAMEKTRWQELASLQGRYASMSGRTQIRAGLVRPEVVVCEDDWPQHTCDSSELVSGVVQVGDLVRIIRSPYLDQVGRVVRLPQERQVIATGSRLRVAEVALADRVIVVPVANLRKLEGGSAQ